MTLEPLSAPTQRRLAAAALSVGAAALSLSSAAWRSAGAAPDRGPSMTLSFVVIAVAMLLCFAGLRRVAAALGALVATFGLLALVRGPLQLDVDGVLLSWIGTSPQMAPNAALSLFLLGFAQAVVGTSEVHRTAQAAAATAAFGIGVLALLALAFRLPMAEVWNGATLKAPTAASIMALAGARFLVVIGPSAGVRWWIPGAVGLGGLAISGWSMIAAHAVLLDQQQREQHLAEGDVAARVELALRVRVDALARLAARHDDTPDTAQSERAWQRDASLVVRDFPGLMTVALVDERHQRPWHNAEGAVVDVAWPDATAHASSTTSSPSSVQRAADRQSALWLSVPFQEPHQADPEVAAEGNAPARRSATGAVVALLDLETTLASLIQEGAASRYHVSVYADDERVVGAGDPNGSDPARRRVAATLNGTRLSVGVTPRSSQAQGGGRLIFVSGASFSVWGAAATTFAERNRVRSREGSQAEHTAHALAQRFGALFDDSPVATLELDLSAAYALVLELGNGDLARGRARIAADPELATRVRAGYDALAVNAATFRLFEATDHAGLERSSRWGAERSDQQHAQAQILDLIDHGHSTREVTLAIGPGIDKRVSSSVRILPGNEQSWSRAVFTLLDLSERAHMEQALRTSLQEKEVLLREVHHRVKNNLQVISSLLSMQARSIKDPAARQPFDDSMARIRAMSLVHEELYQGRDLSRVDFDRTVKRLLEYLEAIHDDRERVVITSDIEPVSLPIDLAIPCGLAITELISNCFKHAFADGRRGVIHVGLHQRGRTIEVVVRDDGLGLPAGFEPVKSTSLGMDLLAAFTEQLRARLSIESTQGTTFRLAFEEDAP